MPFDAAHTETNLHPVVQLLSDARNNITDPRRWTQYRYVDFTTGALCALGSLCFVAGIDAQVNPSLIAFIESGHPKLAIARRLLDEYAQRRGFQSFEKLNDRNPHQEVLAAMDAVIEIAKQLFPTK